MKPIKAWAIVPCWSGKPIKFFHTRSEAIKAISALRCSYSVVRVEIRPLNPQPYWVYLRKTHSFRVVKSNNYND